MRNGPLSGAPVSGPRLLGAGNCVIVATMPRYTLAPVAENQTSHATAEYVCDVRELGKGPRGRRLVLQLGGKTHTAEVLSDGNPLLVLVDHKPIEILEQEGRYVVVGGGPTFEENNRKLSQRRASPVASGAVLAPMPGKVIRVLCQLGNSVEVGTPLLVLEAMKMENELRATRQGRVKAILVAEGQAVESRAKLVELE
jgi:biotin carboxyl carrier protein